ncbi:MAG TPA: glycoside hydrolase family 15 protein [Terriglobales bacterium]|nr:glycoside hydrolase family 15 protein [Terriglobales bacterium]
MPENSRPTEPEAPNERHAAPSDGALTFAPPESRFPWIEDYAVIGDCRSAALVSRSGSMDWLCWPRFDSPSVFASLLDRERGGFWQIAPTDSDLSTERRYLPESNVLETRFTTRSGAATLTDLMPVQDASPAMVPDHEIIRRLTCDSGEVAVGIHFAPRVNYGEKELQIRQAGRLGLRMEDGRRIYWLRSSIPLQLRGSSASACCVLHAGDTLLFSLSYAEDAPAVLPPLDHLESRIENCVDWWRKWAAQAKYDGEFRDEVIRSALALKLLIFAPSGAIVAAPTTSLPERIGGDLNWDYRYCWLRDASLTIRALLELGYWDEAAQFLDWMLHATRLTQPELRILYTVFGNPAPKEHVSQVLHGYRGSAPVRIGNAARDQLQLDVYGEVVDAAAQYAFHGGTLDRAMQKALLGFGNYVLKHWDSPDEGIWEQRTRRRHHTHSRLLCWTALDRLCSLCRQGKLKRAPLDPYKEHAERIRRQIELRGWNRELQAYVSELDGSQLDSSLLLLSWYGFERADSSRMHTTYRALRARLSTPEGLLYRGETLPPEGTFAICSFWEAEYLALGGGTIEQTRDLINVLLRYRNDLGLYAEEIDGATGHALGNFPQAFTHVGFIGAALSLEQRIKGETQLAHRPAGAGRQQGHSKQAA